MWIVGDFMSDEIYHWASDPYWTSALEQYYKIRDSDTERLNIDLHLLEEQIFTTDSPAYRMVEAMCSVKEHEGCDGYRGAPRLVLALLVLLNKQCQLKSNG